MNTYYTVTWKRKGGWSNEAQDYDREADAVKFARKMKARGDVWKTSVFVFQRSDKKIKF